MEGLKRACTNLMRLGTIHSMAPHTPAHHIQLYEDIFLLQPLSPLMDCPRRITGSNYFLEQNRIDPFYRAKLIPLQKLPCRKGLGDSQIEATLNGPLVL
jgi:hypothetical protein